MAISAFNGQAQDLEGNAVTAFQVEVRDETTSNLAAIFSDLAGSTPLGNPFTPSPVDNGHFIFYAEEGRYRIRVFDDSGNLADWRNVDVGVDPTLVSGPSGGVVAGQLAAFADTSGVVIEGVEDDTASPVTVDDLLTSELVVSIDGGGSVITTGIKAAADFHAEFPFTIMGWTLFGDTAGAIVIDIWKDTYANYPPTNADSITNGSEPEITATGVKAQDTDLSDWTTVDVAAGDVLRFNVDSCSSITAASLTLKVKKTSA
jgi:hypothetical protein